MKIAIMQPTYLPWLGYFDLLDQVDKFILLDNVQFEKRSWQQRNRIKTPNGLQWLTVPVVSRGRRDQRILEVKILEAEFWRDHLRSVEVNYRRAPFFDRYFESMSQRIRSESNDLSLAQLTIGMLLWFAEVIGIQTATVRASGLSLQGKRSSLLAGICTSVGATDYLSPLGSADYLLSELATFSERGIAVTFQNYEHPVYQQQFPPFEPYACVLDLLFNEGERAREIIRSGRRPTFLPGQAAAHLNEKVSS